MIAGDSNDYELRVFLQLTIKRIVKYLLNVSVLYGTGSTIAIIGFAIWLD